MSDPAEKLAALSQGTPSADTFRLEEETAEGVTQMNLEDEVLGGASGSQGGPEKNAGEGSSVDLWTKPSGSPCC